MSSNESENERYETLVSGDIHKVIPRLTVPVTIDMTASIIYDMTDAFFVSQPGIGASGAVDIMFSAIVVIQTLSFTTGTGSGNCMARCLGAGCHEGGERAVPVAFSIGFFLGTCLCVFCLFHIDQAMMPLDATETIKPYTMECARYIFLTASFMMCSFIMNSLLRFQGLTAFAMVGVIAGGILNVALDPISIFGPGLGTSGAVTATGLSQFISSYILLAQCSLHRECIHICIGNFRPSLFLYGKILSGGPPSLTRQGMASIATIVLNTTAHPFGGATIAAMAIMNHLIYLVNSAVIGSGQGFQPTCGFSYGIRKYSRVRQAYWFCVKFTTCMLVVVRAGGFLASDRVIGLFRKNDPEAIAIGTPALRLQIATMWMNGFLTMSNVMSQSIDYGFRVTLLAILRQSLLLIPVLLTAAHFPGLLDIQLTQPVADIATLVLTLIIAQGIFRELNKLEDL